MTYSSLNSVNGVSNAHSESDVNSDIDIKIDCKESFEGEAQIIQEIKKVYFPQDQYNNNDNSPSKNENTILSNLSKNKKIDFNFNSEKTIPGIQFLNQNIISSNKNKLDSPKFFNESNKNDIWEKYHASIIDKLEGIDINDSPNCRTMKNVQFSGLEKSNYISEFQEKTIASAGSLYSSNNNFKKMELTNSNYQPNQEKTIPNVLSSQNEVAYSRESYNQSVFTPNNQNESLNQKNSNDLFYINGLNQEISNLFITLQKKPSKNLNKLLSNFELNFEKLCLENDFTEINNETLNLFTTSDSGEFEIIYQPDQYQDELYTNKTVTATMKKLIGSGGYGNVYDFSIKDSLNNYENDKVVGKMFQLNQNSKNDFFFGFNSFLKEWKVLRLFEHENIIKVLGILYRTDLYDSLYNVGILLEKMDCTLEEYLKEMNNYLDFDERLGLALQIVNGLSYIHDKHRIHRDIKPGNILVYEEKQLVKLIDFGTISEDIVESKLIMDDAFTISYAPPEFIRYYYLNEKVQLDFGSDIWSLGVTLFEIFSKNSNLLNFPWVMLISDFEMKNMDSEKLTDSLNKKSLVLEMDEKELQDFVNEKLQNNIQNIKLKELLSKCFLMKPDQRIRIGDLMKELQNLRKTAFHERYEDERIEIRKKSIKSQKSSPNKLKFEKDEEKMNEESLKIIEESQIKKKEIMNNAIKRKNKF